jgi:hypothetical protein
MSLLNDEYKSAINQAMDELFDTFARETPLRFYKPAVEEVVIFDENFNADLSEYSNENAVLTEQYEEFTCRLIYPKRENTFSNFIEGGANIQVKGIQELGILYIQMKEEAFNYLEGCVRFTVFGKKYQQLTTPRRIGVLDTFNTYQITLKEVN